MEIIEEAEIPSCFKKKKKEMRRRLIISSLILNTIPNKFTVFIVRDLGYGIRQFAIREFTSFQWAKRYCVIQYYHTNGHFTWKHNGRYTGFYKECGSRPTPKWWKEKYEDEDILFHKRIKEEQEEGRDGFLLVINRANELPCYTLSLGI